jgi:hypothetical protein
VTDANGTVWSVDQYFASGSPYVTCPTTNTTTNNNIYCSSRFFCSLFGTPFTYNLPVSQNGTFTCYDCIVPNNIALLVTNENWMSSWKVLFVLNDFDIYYVAQPPGRDVPMKKGGRATSIMVVSPEVSLSGTYIAKWY